MEEFNTIDAVDIRELGGMYQALKEQTDSLRKDADEKTYQARIANSALKGHLEKIRYIRDKINIEKILIKEGK